MTVLWTLLPHTATIVTTNTIIATIPTCVSPTTSTVYGSISLCGAPAATYPSPTTGQITCTQPADAPSESVNAFHHIEADDTQGTAFEGCIFAGPSDSTTLSRGTHQCGTSTGVSLSSRKDAAARLIGFTYAGTYSPLFQDYFITRIASTAQTDIQSWGVLNNSVFTTLGGCGAQA
ncbi:hypothetical protein DPSP01_009759 [Paraphaeosphaeria sporulosa]|uniref:Carboxylic ester hydrolase n=1 Tax=Paraphaeosphaeria sporulosa TaxID=1460663 RepID=A0A177CBG7_9PLEO|nr:uncharacterized protein CC84DRAFT_1165343 [Paraphaeosphaeria sporulosa]OAG04994.1 hypothetical protein CC84DRAFT_1165343 [Paraphaeosphaeria sporulosa]